MEAVLVENDFWVVTSGTETRSAGTGSPSVPEATVGAWKYSQR